MRFLVTVNKDIDRIKAIALKGFIGHVSWISRDGPIAIQDMDTNHIVNTLRMVFNHSAPKHLRLHPYNQYRFDKSVYTRSYMESVISCMALEVLERKDLTPHHIRTLNHIFGVKQYAKQIAGDCYGKARTGIGRGEKPKRLEAK